MLMTQRHVASFPQFDDTECATFGPLMQVLQRTLLDVTGALRIYIANMNESTPHFHCHIVPRLSEMPLGGCWMEGLRSVHAHRSKASSSSMTKNRSGFVVRFGNVSKRSPEPLWDLPPRVIFGGDGAVTQPSVRWRLIMALAAMMVAGAVAQGASYWPGIITWDAINQYEQGGSRVVFDDWHPPAMAWLWRQMIAIKAGPEPMYLLQLALYWTGYGLIVGGALRRGKPVAAILVTICALMPFPIAIMGAGTQGLLHGGPDPDGRRAVRLERA